MHKAVVHKASDIVVNLGDFTMQGDFITLTSDKSVRFSSAEYSISDSERLIPFLTFSNGEKVPPDTLDGKLSQLGAKYRKDGRLRERAYFDKWHKHQ